MRTLAGLAMIAGLLTIGGARAGTIDVTPQGLANYAYCLEQARQEETVYPGDRGVGYRCTAETATGYFNALGRRGRDRGRRGGETRETTVRDGAGAYVLRQISGLGNCWHQIEDETGLPVSRWGCDVFVAY